MKRVLIVLGAALLLTSVLATVSIAGGGGPPVDENGCTPSEVFYQGSCQPKSTPVTICHVAGLASDPANFVTLNITLAAAIGEPSGHLNEDGTFLAGHEQDSFGACTPPPTDVCPNLDGVQTEVPDGYVLKDGKCKKVYPPKDVCPNIDGNQPEVPDGMVKDENGDCVEEPPPPTTTTPTTTTPTTPAPPSGAASVICDSGAQVYRVSGTVDGQPADSVNPATIPGYANGTVEVTVTRGDTSVRTTVTVNGDCAPVPTTVTTPTAAATTTTTAPPTTTTPTTTTPAAKPPAAKPPKKAKPPVKKKAVKKRTTTTSKTEHVCKTLADGTKRAWYKGGNGIKPGCYAIIEGSG